MGDYHFDFLWVAQLGMFCLLRIAVVVSHRSSIVGSRRCVFTGDVRAWAGGSEVDLIR